MFKKIFFPLTLLMVEAVAVFPAAGAQAPDGTPDIEDARVTIPYSELKTLWTAAQQRPEKKEEPKPPVQSNIVSATYQIAIAGDQATGSAEFQIQQFTDQWIVMPLMGTEAQLESVDPPDAQIIIRDNYYALASNRPGQQKISVKFATKVNPTPEGAHLGLSIAPASINLLTITGVPDKEALQVGNATEVSGDKTGGTYRLAPLHDLELDLVAEKTLAAPVASHWKIEPQAFVQFKDGKLAYEMRIAAHADDGSGLSMELEFPPDANISSINGADIASWQVRPGEKQSQVAHIQWQTRDTLRRDIEISYDMPQPLTASQWNLVSPRIDDGESSPPLYVVAPESGLELTAADANPTPRQLPEWLSDRARGIDFLVFVGDKPLEAKWLPLVQTPRAVAESVQAKTQVVADGAVLTEITYGVRHETAFSWKLTLPAGAELLAASVDGEAVNPIDCGDHVIEFSLPAGSTSNQVKLSYTAKGAAFGPVSGKIDIDLPETELLTNKLDWEMHIPPAYEVAAFEGNVEPNSDGARTDADSRVIQLHREIFKGEHPSAELFYQKADTAEASASN